jgi:Fe-S oxidoreductase
MKSEDGIPRPGCEECNIRKPVLYDYHIEDARVNDLKSTEKPSLPENREERMEKFKQEIDKCILCYACRQSCYGCYCKNCFIERDATDWQPLEIDTGTKMTFHMGRTMHLAGRCVDCGACEAACASGVNIRYIIKEVTDFVEELYDYRAGLDPEKPPALLENAFDDKEVGFLGGAKHG